jgi:hypothetical protein
MNAWKLGDEFAPFHPSASHVPPDYRDGWNACYRAVLARVAPMQQDAARWRWIRNNVVRMEDYAFSVDEEVEAFVDAKIAGGGGA